MPMNHVLVAELLAEDALLIEIIEQMERALAAGDTATVEKFETQRLKHTNLRNLILSEMENPEIQLYEMQRDHNLVFDDIGS